MNHYIPATKSTKYWSLTEKTNQMNIFEQNLWIYISTRCQVYGRERGREGRMKNGKKAGMHYMLICRIVTDEFSICVPRAVLKGFSYHTALLPHGSIFGAVFWKVIQERFAS